MRSYFRFTILDLAVATVVVALASQIARYNWVDGLVLGVVFFAMWSTGQMIYGLYIRTHDDEDSAAFYRAWVVKFLLMLVILCVIVAWLRSKLLLK